MKMAKGLFIIPMCLALLSGCGDIEIKYYKSNNTSPNQPSQQDKKVEDFFDNSQTTYTDNVTSKTLGDLYETCKKATVTIETYVTYTKQGLTQSTTLYSSGSGFIAKESENYLYIYTNAHVIDVEASSIQSIEIEVILNDYTRYKASKIASDRDEDVAIISIEKPNSNNFLVASLADSSKINPGDTVFAIGSPLGLEYASTITTGIISGVNVAVNENEDSQTMYLLQTDTAINPGNSGGPLFNLNGEVVGVNTLKILESESGVAVEGMGFSIPMNHFNIVANTIINGNTYSRPLLGIQAAAVASLSLETRETYKITIQHGLYIVSVENKDSNLVANTIITHINNQQVYTFSDFASELYNYKKGDSISIAYCNVDGTNTQTITVVLN